MASSAPSVFLVHIGFGGHLQTVMSPHQWGFGRRQLLLGWGACAVCILSPHRVRACAAQDVCGYERDSMDTVVGYDARVIQCLQDYRCTRY